MEFRSIIFCTILAFSFFSFSQNDSPFNKTPENYFNEGKPDSAFYSVRHRLELESDINERIRLLELAGVMYAETSIYDKSIESFFTALQLVHEDSLIKLHSLYFNIGTTYLEAENYLKAIEYLEKSTLFYEQTTTRNFQLLLASYINLSASYIKTNKSKAAFHELDKALILTMPDKYAFYRGDVLINIGDAHLESGHLELAADYLNKSLVAFENSNNHRGLLHTKVSLAEMFWKTKKLDTALQLLNETEHKLKESTDLNYLKENYILKSKIYESQNNIEQAYKYHLLNSKIKDSIQGNQTLSKMLDLNTEFLLLNLKKDTQKNIDLITKEKEIEHYHFILICFIFAIILLFLAILVFAYFYKNKNNQIKFKDSENDKNILKNELKFKQKELMSFAFNIIQKESLLLQLKKELIDIKKNSTDKNVEKIKNLIIKLTQSLKINKELEEFNKNVNDISFDYFEKLNLIHNDLTENEKRLTVLLQLGFSSKEIAVLNEISEGAVTMARYRLRKKMNLDKGVNLTDYLNKLF